MRVAVATFTGLPEQFTDDERLAEALRDRGAEVERVPWNDQAVEWAGFDAVVIRSTWDYTLQREEFLRWADRIGHRLHNGPAVVRWNSDKRYLADLASAGIAVIPTTFVDPGQPIPELTGDVVVKPTVSAGARNTGRFSEATHGAARDLIQRIQAMDRTAMVQPYQSSVDEHGETAIVCLAGRPSHVLRKKAVLRPDEVAPVRDDAVGAAEVMYDPDLVVAGVANEAELALAGEVLAYLTERFGRQPLYGRVDLVQGADGRPTLMELELIEPNLYLSQAPGAAERVAAAIMAALSAEGVG